MIGPILSLVSSAVFGINSTVNRRAVLRVKSSYVTHSSIFTGVPFFLLATTITGDLFRLGQYSWKIYLLFAIAGVIHFALGRRWAYVSLHLIGATRSGMVTNINFVVTIVLTLIIFRESISRMVVIGILLALIGPFLISVKEASARNGDSLRVKSVITVDRSTLSKGILFAAGTALMWGSSPIFIKLATDAGGPPVLGSLISYVAASIAVSPSAFLDAENRKITLKTPWQTARLALLGGLTSNTAQLFRYLALGFGPLILVSIVQRTQPVFMLLFAFIFNRQYESLSRWVLLGNGLLILGTLVALLP